MYFIFLFYIIFICLLDGLLTLFFSLTSDLIKIHYQDLIIDMEDFIILLKRAKRLLHGIVSITIYSCLNLIMVNYFFVSYSLIVACIYLLFYSTWMVCCIIYVYGGPNIHILWIE